MLTFLPLFVIVTGIHAATIQVNVAEHGLGFSPNSITASSGDIIAFHFYSGRHSVVSGEFSSPCSPSTNAFFSGYLNGAEDGSEVFMITVESTDPIWFYCSSSNHCQSGMVGVINPPSNGQLASYSAAAKAVGRASAPSAPTGGTVTTLGSTPTSASSVEPVSSATSSVISSTSSAASSAATSDAGSSSSSVISSLSQTTVSTTTQGNTGTSVSTSDTTINTSTRTSASPAGGSAQSSSASQKSSSNLGLKVGLGVGIPAFVLLLAGLGYFILQQRKSSKAIKALQAQLAAGDPQKPELGDTTVSRRPMTELESQDIQPRVVSEMYGGARGPLPHELGGTRAPLPHELEATRRYGG